MSVITWIATALTVLCLVLGMAWVALPFMLVAALSASDDTTPTNRRSPL